MPTPGREAWGYLPKSLNSAVALKAISDLRLDPYPRAILKFCPPSGLDFRAHHCSKMQLVLETLSISLFINQRIILICISSLFCSFFFYSDFQRYGGDCLASLISVAFQNHVISWSSCWEVFFCSSWKLQSSFINFFSSHILKYLSIASTTSSGTNFSA